MFIQVTTFGSLSHLFRYACREVWGDNSTCRLQLCSNQYLIYSSYRCYSKRSSLGYCKQALVATTCRYTKRSNNWKINLSAIGNYIRCCVVSRTRLTALCRHPIKNCCGCHFSHHSWSNEWCRVQSTKSGCLYKHRRNIGKFRKCLGFCNTL